ILEIDPKFIFALDNKCLALSNLGRNEEAIECCDRILEIDPKYVKAICNKGISLMELGRKEEGRECYNKALEIDPAYVNKLYGKNFSSKPLTQMKEIVKTWKFWEKRKEPYYINDLLTQY